MWQALRSVWGKWREGRRQYALDRALYRGYRRRAEDDFFAHAGGLVEPVEPTPRALKDSAPPSVGP